MFDTTGGTLDLRTLFVTLILVLSTSSFFLYFVWKFHRKSFPGIGYWLSSSIFQALGFIFIALRNFLPDLLSITLANSLLFFSTALTYTGVELFQTGKKTRCFPYFVSLAATVLNLYFTLYDPNLAARIVLLSCVGTFHLTLCILRFRSPKEATLWPTIIPIASLFFIATVSLFRIPATLLRSPGADLMTTGWYQGVFIMGYIVGTLGWMAGLLLVVSWRLQKEQERLARTNQMIIREMHHRIKNNLMTLRGMVHIQAALSESAELKNALAKNCHRIDAIAKIHDLLHLSEELASASSKTYFEKLAQSLAATYSNPRVKLELDIADIHLSIKDLIPLGLILNELISNAYDHAFPEDRPGKISVLFLRREGALELSVSDDGVGFPDMAKNIEALSSLGMKIVESLSRQLRGTLSIESRPHASLRLVFPLEAAAADRAEG